MAILHYTIGLPPARSGGSVQYASDLIREQAKTQEVLALVAGDPLFRGGKARIRQKHSRDDVRVFELTNPLTPTLIYGTSHPESQHRELQVDYDGIRSFIESNCITVMHIHTLMGLHAEIVRFIKSLGVRIVYTTHDFHGICLHYDFIGPDGRICETVDGARCAACNRHEPSDIFLRLANSKLYHKLKSLGVVRLLGRPTVPVKESADKHEGWPAVSGKDADSYSSLIAYYREYFSLIDKFHFNSTQTQHIFNKFLPTARGQVMPVITGGIGDNRRKLDLKEKVRFGFIGNLSDFKGFPMLRQAIADLVSEGYCNFSLNVYGGGSGTRQDADCSAIIYHPPYRYSEISDVMYGLDCVIIPSKCFETFSLVALEAIAHGRPVMVSDRVGAKDIVRRYDAEMVFDSPESLKALLRKVLDHPEILVAFSERVSSAEWNYSLEAHAREMIEFYFL